MTVDDEAAAVMAKLAGQIGDEVDAAAAAMERGAREVVDALRSLGDLGGRWATEFERMELHHAARGVIADADRRRRTAQPDRAQGNRCS
jgi:hypothetical protein